MEYMKRLHPPIHLLLAFVATARQSTISGAARELHLTQGAVSKQVSELEQMLVLELFLRVRGRLVLSPAAGDVSRRSVWSHRAGEKETADD